MSKVTYAINLTADGCCAHDKFSPREEMMDYFTSLWDGVGLIVWGRKTYELMVPYWLDVARDQSGTKEENAFAVRLAEIPKVVFSRTLKSAEGNTRIVSGDLAEEFEKLKQEAGSKSISTGGVSLPSQLIELGLIDDIRFIVHSIIGGAGRKIFAEANLDHNFELELADTKTFGTGAIVLHYVRK